MNDRPGEADASDWLQAQFAEPGQPPEPDRPPELVEPDVDAPDTLGGILGTAGAVGGGRVPPGYPVAGDPAGQHPAPARPAPEPFRWGLAAAGTGAAVAEAAPSRPPGESDPAAAATGAYELAPDWPLGPRTARQTFLPAASASATELLPAGPADQSLTEATPTVSFLAGLRPTGPVPTRPAGLPDETTVRLPTERSRSREGDDSALTALFASRRFQDDLATADDTPPAPAVRPPAPAEPDTRPAGVSRRQRMLLVTALGVVAALALVVLFFVGTRLPELLGAAPAPAPKASPSASVSPTPTPTPSALPTAAGPLAPGTYRWEQLAGGECLGSYSSPWAERFTVVDCSQPHPAQLVHRGLFDAAAGSAYPGAAALQAQVTPLCSAPTVVNFAAAGAFHDLQLAESFPADQKQWAGGNRAYYCFVTRKSGEPLTGSVAVPVG